MSPREKKQSISSGHTIAMKHLMGSGNDDRRARMKAAGCVFDNPAKAWICPNQETYAQFMSELGLAPSKPMPKPVVVPAVLPTIVAPMPGAVAPVPAPLPEVKLVATQPVTETEPAKPVEQKQVKAPEPVVIGQGKRVLELPPSFIVSQEVQQRGDKRYFTLEEDITNSEDDEGTTIAKTRRLTEKVVKDPEEDKAAGKLASQLRAIVRKLGSVIQNGVILVPVAKEKELDQAISEVRRKAVEFNRTAQHHYVRVSILKSLITSDSEAAARDVAARLQEMTIDIKAALESCDVSKIKSVIDNAKPLARILPAREANALTGMLSSANNTKKWIDEALTEKKMAIEVVRKEVQRTALGPIDSARMTFLELALPEDVEVRNLADTPRFEELDGSKSENVQSAAVANGDRFDM